MGKPPRLVEGNDRTTYQDGWDAPLLKKTQLENWNYFFRGEITDQNREILPFILGHLKRGYTVTQLLRRGSS